MGNKAICCSQSSITLWILLTSDHIVVLKSSPSCLKVFNNLSPIGNKVIWSIYPQAQVVLNQSQSEHEGVTKWSITTGSEYGPQVVPFWSQGSQMVVPKKSSSGPQLVVTEPLLAFLIWSQVVHNWSYYFVTLPGYLNQYAMTQMTLRQTDQRLLNIRMTLLNLYWLGMQCMLKSESSKRETCAVCSPWAPL